MEQVTLNDVSTIIIGAIAVIGCAVGLMTYFRNARTADKKQAEEWGELKANISHIKINVEEMKTCFDSAKKAQDVAISRVYERMDERFTEHERQYHAGEK